MTNKEAIAIFKVWIQRDKELQEKGLVDRLENIELYNMAISALENNYNSAENNYNDLISKQKVLDLPRIKHEPIKGYGIIEYINVDDIKKLPSAEKTAEWYDKKMTIKKAHGIAYGRWGCSSCKAKFPQKSNYCPNCGAKMGESEEEE